MVSIKKRIVAWTMMVVVVGGGLARPVVAEDDPRVRAYQEQLDRLQKEMDELCRQFASGWQAVPLAAFRTPREVTQ